MFAAAGTAALAITVTKATHTNIVSMVPISTALRIGPITFFPSKPTTDDRVRRRLFKSTFRDIAHAKSRRNSLGNRPVVLRMATLNALIKPDHWLRGASEISRELRCPLKYDQSHCLCTRRRF
jgi:hypothetical protein